MGFGRTFEEFEVGAVYKHWPGKTVTEYDDHLFCLLTMNHHPLHLDAHYAEETTDFGRNVVVGNYVYSLLLGMSVPGRLRQGDRQPRGRVAAARRADVPRRHDLRRDDGAGQAAVQLEDRPRRGYVETRGHNQDGTAGLRLPAEGHGADGGVRPGPRRRATWAAGHGVLVREGTPERTGRSRWPSDSHSW